MSADIKDTTQTAYIPQDTSSDGNKLEKNPFFAFMMALGVIPSEAQRSTYGALDQKVEISKLRMDKLQDQLSETVDTVNLDNSVQVNPELLAIQQKMTKEKSIQEFVIDKDMKQLSDEIKGSQTMAYKFLNSLLRVTGAPGRRVY